MSESTREMAFPASPEFAERWSPRAFTDEPIDEATLFTILEAARWAPSAFNAQPWHVVYVLRARNRWGEVYDALSAGNQAWAGRAAALLTILSRNVVTRPGDTAPVPSATHAFDAGCAWGFLALQAHRMGWATHAMAGFDGARLRSVLNVPDTYSINAVVAIGRRGDGAMLPEGQAQREAPSPRRPVSEFASIDSFRR
jgi:nitroreductase